MGTMIIDAHLHWLPGEPGNDPEIVVNSGIIKGGWILSVGDLAHGFGTDEAIIALCRKYPDFFHAFGYLDFDEAGPERIDYLFKEGCVGLKAIWPGKPYDDPSYFPYYEKAERLGMPIVFHLGGAPYWGPERARVPGYRQYSKNMMSLSVDTIAKTFLNLTMVMAHMGGGNVDPWANLVAHGNPRVYMDVSAIDEDTISKAIKSVGAHKILFGSDGKTLNGLADAEKLNSFFQYYENRLQEYKQRILGEGQFKQYADKIDEPRNLIMGGNAARIMAEARAKQAFVNKKQCGHGPA